MNDDQKNRDMPLHMQAPCSGCRFMKAALHHPDYYVQCGYYDDKPMPDLPFMWRALATKPNHVGDQGSTTRKHVEGPFTADAVQGICAFKST